MNTIEQQETTAILYAFLKECQKLSDARANDTRKAAARDEAAVRTRYEKSLYERGDADRVDVEKLHQQAEQKAMDMYRQRIRPRRELLEAYQSVSGRIRIILEEADGITFPADKATAAITDLQKAFTEDLRLRSAGDARLRTQSMTVAFVNYTIFTFLFSLQHQADRLPPVYCALATGVGGFGILFSTFTLALHTLDGARMHYREEKLQKLGSRFCTWTQHIASCGESPDTGLERR